MIAALLAPYILFGLFANATCYDTKPKVWGRWVANAPTTDAKIFLGVTFGILWLPTLLLFWIFHFLKGAFDLIPRRKEKIPTARVI